MPIEIDEENLKEGLLGLVVALVEIIQELLELQAIRRMESGVLSDDEVERLGQALIDLEAALDKIKADNGIEDAVSSVREGLDDLVDDLIDNLLDPDLSNAEVRGLCKREPCEKMPGTSTASAGRTTEKT